MQTEKLLSALAQISTSPLSGTQQVQQTCTHSTGHVQPAEPSESTYRPAPLPVSSAPHLHASFKKEPLEPSVDPFPELGATPPLPEGGSGTGNGGFWTIPQVVDAGAAQAHAHSMHTRHSAPGGCAAFSAGTAAHERGGMLGLVIAAATLENQPECDSWRNRRGVDTGACGGATDAMQVTDVGRRMPPAAFQGALPLVGAAGVQDVGLGGAAGADPTSTWLSGPLQPMSDRASDFSLLLSGLLGNAPVRPQGLQQQLQQAGGLSVRSICGA